MSVYRLTEILVQTRNIGPTAFGVSDAKYNI